MKSWKTSLFGVLGSLGAIISSSSPEGTALHNTGGVIAAVGVLLMGLFAKDRNVTGGTTPQ